MTAIVLNPCACTVRTLALRTRWRREQWVHPTDRPLVAELGIDHLAANALVVKAGVVTGELDRPIVDRASKAAAWRVRWPAGVPLVAHHPVGDGASDIDMLAGGRARHRVQRQAVVRQAAGARPQRPLSRRHPLPARHFATRGGAGGPARRGDHVTVLAQGVQGRAAGPRRAPRSCRAGSRLGAFFAHQLLGEAVPDRRRPRRHRRFWSCCGLRRRDVGHVRHRARPSIGCVVRVGVAAHAPGGSQRDLRRHRRDLYGGGGPVVDRVGRGADPRHGLGGCGRRDRTAGCFSTHRNGSSPSPTWSWACARLVAPQKLVAQPGYRAVSP